MTYHLAAFRLHSIGERSARFAEVTLDFTAPDGDSPSPADTVVWLRNGGGKSSLLSLCYALMLPNANDFMGRVVKRSLTDYVDSGDTAHTIAVWHPAVSRTLDGTPDQILVTGAVYEWSDLRRPVDADRARDKLDTTFYAFYAVPGVLDLDLLPILDETGAPLRRASFIAAIREIAAVHPQATDWVATEKQHEWATALTNRGLDPALFRTQKQMNHVEGGVEDMFKFSSAREFVDLLVDLTVAPEDPANVANRLSTIASLLATKPAKVAEREFCLDAATSLDRVVVAHREVTHSVSELQRVTTAAADLAAAFETAAVEAETQIELLVERHGEIDRRRGAADLERGIAYDLVYLYEQRAAQLRIAEAEMRVTAAGDSIAAAESLTAAWEVAGHLATMSDLESRLAQTRQEAQAERERTAPQRLEHDQHAARLRSRLLWLAADHDDRATAATSAAEAADADVDTHRRAANTAQGEMTAADKEAATATAILDSLAADLRAAVRDGVLPTEDTDPGSYDAVLAESQDELEAAAEAARIRRAERPAVRNHLTGKLTTLAAEQSARDGERTRLAGERATLTERAADLAALDRIRDLTEATEDAPVDLWAESDTLIRRLSDEILSTDVALVRLEVERGDDRRTLDVHARTGLLPTTVDAERVQTVLAQRGIVTETGWAHLLALVTDERLVDMFSDPEVTKLGVGLVVATEDAENAADALTAFDTATTALVGVYTAQAASAIVRADRVDLDGARPVWTGLHRGLVDTTAAESTVRQVSARADQHDAKQTELTRCREADRRFLGALTALLADCPAGHLDSLSSRLDDLDEALAGIGTAIAQVNGQLEELDTNEKADAELEQRTQAAITQLAKIRTVLARLVERVADSARVRENLAKAEAASRLAGELIERHVGVADRARDIASEQRSLAKTEKATATDRRAEAAGLRFLDTEPDVAADPAVSLDALRARYGDAERAWEVRAAGSVLAERERSLSAALAMEIVALTGLSEEVKSHAAMLVTTADGQTSATRAIALAAARQAEKDAFGHREGAKSDLKLHKATLEKIRKRRTEPPRRALPVEPAGPEHADELAAEHDRVGQGCIERRTAAERELAELDRRKTALSNRVTTFRLLADGLPAPTGQAVPPFPGHETDAPAVRREVFGKVTAAQGRVNEAMTGRTQAVAALRTLGGRYPTVATPAKDRVLHDGEDVLAQHADSLGNQLQLRAEMIDGELDGIAKDQAIITDSLCRLVSSTLDTLRKAERYSKVNTPIGGWSGKQMLRIAFDSPASEADLRTYIDRVIERRIAERVKPEGLPLLKDAVHEAVGPRGFTVKVLKPTLDVVATTEDITRLGKWSGGEKLTVCVALYCTIAALRAANAGRRDRSGGVLLLDNPIGRASHGSLVRLQRAVAAAHRVQLVYTTGVKDPDAVSRFPNVIRLDNRPGRTHSRRYIVPDTAPVSGDGPDPSVITGVRVAHSEADLQEDT